MDILQSQRHILLVKGSPDTLIPRCTSHIARVDPQNPDNNKLYPKPLGDEFVRTLERVGAEYASRGWRLVALACRLMSDEEARGVLDPREADTTARCQRAESNLCFLGFAALSDPPNELAAGALPLCVCVLYCSIYLSLALCVVVCVVQRTSRVALTPAFAFV